MDSNIYKPNHHNLKQEIAISPSYISMIDAIAQYEKKSRADVLEELIDREFRAFVLTADEKKLEDAGLIE